MKDIIKVNITKDHIYDCKTRKIGRKGENISTTFEITLEEELLNLDVYIEFLKPNGESLVTPKLDLIGNIATYDVPLYILDTAGNLKVQIVLRDIETGEIWKTFIKTYIIEEGICACDDIPNKEDWMTNAQKTLDNVETLKEEVENGLTPTIGDNENWFICGKDTGRPSRGKTGDTYEITDDDYEEIENQVKTDIQPILEEIEKTSKQAEIIAKGRATGYVFDTVADLDSWLLVEENRSKLVLGDNLYIRAIGVPDYWWDGSSKQVLETEKPDLTNYAKQEQFVTLTQAEYDALTEKSANTYYFIIEEE